MGINVLFSILVVLGFLLSFSSCHKENDIVYDNNGVAVKLPPLWKTSISDNGELAQIVIGTPIIYNNDKCLVGGNYKNQRSIISIDSKDGGKNWEWSDLLSLLFNSDYKDPIYIYKHTYHKNNNAFFFTYSTSSYCIDLSTGNTSWRYKTHRSRRSVNGGIDNTYFTSGANYDSIDDEKVYYGEMLSSAEEQLLLIPEYTHVDNSVNVGIISYITPFKNEDSAYLAFGVENPYTDFTTKEGMGSSELNLYNVTKDEYVYKKIVINPERETRLIDDMYYQAPNLYFQSSNYIHSYNAMSGKENWKTFIGSSPLLSAMLLADNRLYSACENRYLYCVDATTGNMLWKVENTGTCSELSYLNGVLYYLGGGDGLLHAVDAQTGKHLWKIQSPDLRANSGAWFYGVCVAVPGQNGKKGVVVATTGLNAYGYEAVK